MSIQAGLPFSYDPNALRTRLIGAAIAVGTSVAVVSLAAAFWLNLGLAHHGATAAVFIAIGAVAANGVGPYHAHPSLGVANGITLIRAGMTALVAGATAEAFANGASVELAWSVTAVSALALLLDGVDGWIARRQGMASAFGARFDMEVDALLILVLSLFAALLGKAGWWIALAGLLRYLFVAAGFLWPWMNAALPDSFRRKLVCVVQAAALVALAAPPVAPPWSVAIAAVSLVVLAWSFAVDTLWLFRRRGEEGG